MAAIRKVTQRLRQVPMFRRLLRREDGLINTTDLLVATGATVILAAGITGATLSAWTDDAEHSWYSEPWFAAADAPQAQAA